MSVQVVVFIDYQNVYRRARAKFHSEDIDPHWYGQIDPLALAQHLTDSSRDPRELQAVRIYRGMPSSSKDPKGYGAVRRQFAAWEQSSPLVKVISRPLQYPADWIGRSGDEVHSLQPREKGIDVALALDVAVMALRKEYDVAILCSLDTDLVPAMEVVYEQQRAWGKPRIEVAAWTAEGEVNPRLSVPGQRIYCHWINRETYERMRDNRNYSR